MSLRTAKNPNGPRFGRSAFFWERTDRRTKRWEADYLAWEFRCAGPDPEKPGAWIYYAGCLPRPWKVHGRIHRKNK